MMREGTMILVTGGSGYVGSHTVRRLAGAGRRVRVLVHDRRRAEREARLSDLPVEWAEGDVTRAETLPAAFDGVETVIHTVAIAVEKGDRTYERINVEGTANVLRAATDARVRRFINMCQLGADQNLPYRFLASKGKAQVLVAESALDWTAFRPSVIWGPEDEFANTFARLAQLTPVIFPIVGGGQARFEPVWIEDVVTSIEKSLDDRATYRKEFELGGPEVLTLEQIERRALAGLGARRMFVNFPLPLIRIAVALMDTLLPSPPVTRSLLEQLAVDNVTRENSISRFVEHPRPFTSDAIADYVGKFSPGQTIRQYLGG
jgi:NADH dehydrogenase